MPIPRPLPRSRPCVKASARLRLRAESKSPPMPSCCFRWVVFHLPLRRGLSGVLPSRLAHALRARHAVPGRAPALEHVLDGIAPALRHQPAHDLGDTGAESHAEPFGIARYRTGSHVGPRPALGPVARYGAP